MEIKVKNGSADLEFESAKLALGYLMVIIIYSDLE